MAKFTDEQITSAIEAEVAHWAHGFRVTDPEEIEGRRRFHRANLASDHIGCLIDFIAPSPSAYEAGYRAFSDDDDGSIAKAVSDHFSGTMRLDSTRYSDDWFNGYQDATDDFNQAQAGGE